MQLWTEGQMYPEILDKIKKNHENNVINKLVGKRWCVKFSCFNAKSDASRLVSILQGMSEIFDRAGSVDLKNPETRIAIIEVRLSIYALWMHCEAMRKCWQGSGVTVLPGTGVPMP